MIQSIDGFRQHMKLFWILLIQLINSSTLCTAQNTHDQNSVVMAASKDAIYLAHHDSIMKFDLQTESKSWFKTDLHLTPSFEPKLLAVSGLENKIVVHYQSDDDGESIISLN